MIYAYIRVSSDKQTVENQRDAIQSSGYNIDKWLCDEAVSGTVNWKARDIEKAVRKSIEGDTIVVAELSRLGRSLKQILEIVEICQKKKVKIVMLRESITIEETNPMTKLMVSILGSLAELERNLISERTKDALALRRKQGVILGRPVGSLSDPQKTKLGRKENHVKALAEMGVSKTQAAKLLKVNRNTLLKYIKQESIEWAPADGRSNIYHSVTVPVVEDIGRRL